MSLRRPDHAVLRRGQLISSEYASRAPDDAFELQCSLNSSTMPMPVPVPELGRFCYGVCCYQITRLVPLGQVKLPCAARTF